MRHGKISRSLIIRFCFAQKEKKIYKYLSMHFFDISWYSLIELLKKIMYINKYFKPSMALGRNVRGFSRSWSHAGFFLFFFYFNENPESFKFQNIIRWACKPWNILIWNIHILFTLSFIIYHMYLNSLQQCQQM